MAQLRCPVEAMADVRVTPRFVHGLHLVHVNLYDLYAGQASSRFIKHLRNHLCFVDCSSAACSNILQRIRECHAPAFCPSMPCLVSKSTVALLFELVNVCQLQLELCLPRHQVGPNGRNAQAADRRGSPQPNENWHWAKKDILGILSYLSFGFDNCEHNAWRGAGLHLSQTDFLPACCQDTGEPLRVFSGFASPNHHLSPRAIQACSH